ncbi:MAG: molybdate ABC transporter substrate-binding protein [Acidobacteria bacterium]|nr:molybdate ABC transporter substrate-binding protein [Acidobacteriota bacterium]
MQTRREPGGETVWRPTPDWLVSRRHVMRLVLVAGSLFVSSCKSVDKQAEGLPEELVVAAAANLTEAFQQIGSAFARESGVKIIYNFGATAQLTQQIENGAPFDLFAAADVAHIDQLVNSRKITPESRAVYARGRLALWVPKKTGIEVRQLADLVQPSVRIIAIASPEIAPYGAAAVEVMKKQNLWEGLEPKIVRAENVIAAKQLAATGNADAVFTAYSLVLNDPGAIILLDESLRSPLDQALGIVASSERQQSARRFAEFILRGRGREILTRFGYALPLVP